MPDVSRGDLWEDRARMILSFVCAFLWLLSAGPPAHAEPPSAKAAQRLVVAIDYAFPPHQWIDDKGEARQIGNMPSWNR